MQYKQNLHTHTTLCDGADSPEEIVLAALRAVHELRDESRFEPWLWGVAANVTRSFRRMQGRARAMYVWDAWEALGDTPASEDEDVEAEIRSVLDLSLMFFGLSFDLVFGF